MFTHAELWKIKSFIYIKNADHLKRVTLLLLPLLRCPRPQQIIPGQTPPNIDGYFAHCFLHIIYHPVPIFLLYSTVILFNLVYCIYRLYYNSTLLFTVVQPWQFILFYFIVFLSYLNLVNSKYFYSTFIYFITCPLLSVCNVAPNDQSKFLVCENYLAIKTFLILIQKQPH